MNADNLNRVADAIENHEIAWLGFNMETIVSAISPDRSGHACGTTACIAGWTFAVDVCPKDSSDLFQKDAMCISTVWNQAAKYLELTGDSEPYEENGEDYALFYGHPTDVAFSDVTSAQAVKTLRYAAKHGVIDWDAAQA